MNHADRLNMTDTASTTAPIQVPAGAAKLSIDINDGSSFTWGVAAVDLQFSLSIDQDDIGTDLTNWQNVSPAVQFVTGTRSRRAVSVTGMGWVRFKVTTAASGADISAVVTMQRNWNA